ncbi:MAG: PD40 domain-containing protein [Pyrinomonadaceae bacterium]|nr:PD40 domain-containing protein [Pyrinomonadaceae bacterium]
MKQGFRLLYAAALLFVILGAANLSYAQTATPTPTPTPTPPPGVDTIITQLTSSPAARNSFVGDISANGRFVVFESNGDLSTEKSVDGRDNTDGNREIFLLDYAQRRIFQITNTTSVRIDTTKTFTEIINNIKYEISNNRPRLTYGPTANGSGQRVYSIVFSSNAGNPASFNGEANEAAIAADGNQEIWVYQVPQIVDNLDLSSGADLPRINLATGTFTQITSTPASRQLQAGTTTRSPDVIDDNREAFINDDGTIIAFTSTRCPPTAGGSTCAASTNSDANPEIFIHNRTNGAYVQVTNTQTANITNPIVNQNPNLSGDGTRLAFISNANITSTNADGNMEIYVAEFNGTAMSGLRQVTRTTASSAGISVNIFSPGRRMSRNGNLLAFESSSNDPKSNGAIQPALATFIYDIVADAFTQVGARSTTTTDVLRFPTFTGDNSRLVFVSALNFLANGTLATTNTEGLNPTLAGINRPQIFSVPVNSPNTFRILTNMPITNGSSTQPFVGQTQQRIAFSIGSTELGGGNPDNSVEAFYLLTPPAATDTNGTLSFFTGASQRPVTGPSPTAPAVQGLAGGMLGIVRSTTALAPSSQAVTNASESKNSPPLPTELKGVTVAINGAAAGLYFVSTGEIQFVVPRGLAVTTGNTTYPVVINNNGSVIRGTIQITPAQPDIFTSTNDAGGRARVFVRNTMTAEPFTVPVEVSIFLTGVRNVQTSQVTVRVGTVDLSGTAILSVMPTDTPGIDQIDVALPASLAGAGDVPIIVSVTINGQTFTSRPADTAPRIRIN